MLLHPDSLTLPFREGIRDLKSSIRLEARAGTLSSRFLGTPEPTRRLARLADGVLTRAEGLAGHGRSRDGADLRRRLRRLARTLDGDGGGAEAADVYALCRAALEGEEPSGALVSEMRLAVIGSQGLVRGGADPFRAAAEAAGRTAALGIVRPCLGTVLSRHRLPGDRGPHLNVHVALVVWLAVLVARSSEAEPDAILAGARRAVEAEGEQWHPLLREGRDAELADAWRETAPYLP